MPFLNLLVFCQFTYKVHCYSKCLFFTEVEEELPSGEDPDDEPLEQEDLVEKYFDIVETKRTSKHVKVCISCNGTCNADIVKCFYCEEVVLSENLSNHMEDVHPRTPAASLHPVTCKFVKHQSAAPDVIARPVENNSKFNTMHVYLPLR